MTASSALPKHSSAPFVPPGSIVRAVWGDADTMLLVFAGAAAEFALNRAVDWLFVTGKLPQDPVGRLFTTAAVAQSVVFADRASAEQQLERLNRIHAAVERQRGAAIPAWAHRDVLYLLIAYSERAFALLHRPLRPAEREELYAVFREVGELLAIPDLPPNYAAWVADRERHLARDLAWSPHTAQLYARYRAALGAWRYALLLQVQLLLAPPVVRRQLPTFRLPGLALSVPVYRLIRRLGLRALAQRLLIPPQYLDAIRALDDASASDTSCSVRY